MADRRLAWALAAVTVRYLTTVRPHARRELARWRQRAHAIPDPTLRAHVLRPLDADRSAEGAALFAVLAPRPDRGLVSLLVAYVLLWSYVDVVTERDPDHDPRLYDALLDVLDPGGGAVDYGNALNDRDYLADLIQTCHEGCTTLPSWHVVGPYVLRLADDGRAVQAINHGPRRGTEARLRAWAARHPAGARPERWHERCAAASSPLAIVALLALAARPDATTEQASATATAYYPSISALGVLADHYTDRVEDTALSNHTYLRYYETPADVADGLRDLASAARRGLSALHDRDRHAVILAAMIGMFLSHEQAWTPENAETSHTLLSAVGEPARLLLAVLRFGRPLAARNRRSRSRAT